MDAYDWGFDIDPLIEFASCTELLQYRAKLPKNAFIRGGWRYEPGGHPSARLEYNGADPPAM
eukprot:5115060-Karenia_brevis.AAC.1